MPARDILHDVVRDALIQDGWTITHDPFVIPFGRRKIYADLGAERALVAEKREEKIVVEIKSFVGLSRMADLQQALGQFTMYKVLLADKHPEYTVYLAMDDFVFEEMFLDADGEVLLAGSALRIVTIDTEARSIQRWIN